MAAGAAKVQVTLLMAVLVMMVVATSVVIVDARLDFSQILGSFGIQTDSYVTPEYRGGSEACCDNCICPWSQCRCTDIKTTCYQGCRGCLCTRSWPIKCLCIDVENFCYKPCNTTTTTEK